MLGNNNLILFQPASASRAVTCLSRNAPSLRPKGVGLLQGTAGFLAYADEEASSSGEGVPHKLVVGQVLDCLVTACADKRLVHVTADPSRVAAALSPDWGDASIGGGACWCGAASAACRLAAHVLSLGRSGRLGFRV